VCACLVIDNALPVCLLNLSIPHTRPQGNQSHGEVRYQSENGGNILGHDPLLPQVNRMFLLYVYIILM